MIFFRLERRPELEGLPGEPTPPASQSSFARFGSQHPGVVITMVLAIISLLGLMYDWLLLRGFGINYFQFAGVDDFLVGFGKIINALMDVDSASRLSYTLMLIAPALAIAYALWIGSFRSRSIREKIKRLTDRQELIQEEVKIAEKEGEEDTARRLRESSAYLESLKKEAERRLKDGPPLSYILALLANFAVIVTLGLSGALVFTAGDVRQQIACGLTAPEAVLLRTDSGSKPLSETPVYFVAATHRYMFFYAPQSVDAPDGDLVKKGADCGTGTLYVVPSDSVLSIKLLASPRRFIPSWMKWIEDLLRKSGLQMFS